MISDILYHAVDDIQFYLDKPMYDDDRKEIEALLTTMDNLRARLDTPPDLHSDPRTFLDKFLDTINKFLDTINSLSAKGDKTNV
jgi:hypothetical protein